jgi:hypothetical protein
MAFSTSVTKAADDSLLSFPHDQRRRDAWQEMIDGPLLEIARAPQQFAEDDLTPPSATAIDIAMMIARQLRNGDMDPPRTIVPNGDGGILFEWGRPGDLYLTLEIDEKGPAVYALSRNCTPVFKQRLL